MFAVLWVPRFPLQAVMRWRETSGPTAVVDGDARRGAILECDDAAAAAGVEIGMAPARALARCGSLALVPRSAAQEAAAQALLVEIATAFSARVEATAEGLCTLDLAGAARGTCWQRLGEDMVARCGAVGLAARVGVAASADHAALAARRAEPVNVVYDAAAYCAGLPVALLAPSPELAAVFADWGIRCIGDFLRLPREAVTERLGAEALILWRRATGRSRRPLRLVRPAESFIEAFDFDHAVETSEPLLFLLRRFADALAARLRAAHRVAEALTLTLPLEDAPAYERRFSVPAPTASADAWFRILSTHLEALTLEHRPVGVRLAVEAGAASGRQLSLFESTLRDPNRFGETLAQLKALVGEGNVGVPRPADSHRPGAFELAEFSETVEGDAAPLRARGLPLRRYRPARRVGVRAVGGRPAWVEGFGPVARAEGPYALSGGWWEREWRLEEWDVELAEGRGLLRLAWRPGNRWTVEGAYDVLR